jgi:hypothetical protein
LRTVKRLPHSRAADVGDEAAELLLPLLVPLDHAHHDLDRETGSQVRALGLDLGVLDFLQQAHSGLLSTTRDGRSRGDRQLQAAEQYTGALNGVSRHYSAEVCPVFAGIQDGSADANPRSI